jgi:DNA-binding SARP family transcriptional activator
MMTSDGGLRLEVLGPVRAWRGDLELDLGSTHRRTVVAVLGMSAGHTVSRHGLADAIWGDEPPSSADGSIYSYISALRKVLEPERRPRSGDGLLASVGAGYSLRVEDDRVDVNRFHAYRASASKQRRTGRPEHALRDLEQALGLWRGEALSGLPGRFADAQRAKLGELRLATLETRAEILLELGDPAEVIGELNELRREHPLRESVAVLVMEAMAKDGRAAEAIEVFDDVRTSLVEAAGLEPGPQLLQLHRRLVEGKTVVGRSKPAVPAGEPPAGPGRPETFVGREDELNSLRTAVSGLRSGRGEAIWLEGEPGIGKTALLAEAFAGPPGSEATLRWATAQELDSGTPGQFVRECLDALGDPSCAGPHQDDAASDITRLAGILTDLAAGGPLVVVADDFQWADDRSAEAWSRLTRLCDRLPMLLVAVSRPLPRSETMERVKVRVIDNGRAIALGPLTEPEVVHLAERLAGSRLSGGLRGALDDGGGNPRYLTEIVRSDLATSWGPAGQGDAPDLPAQLIARLGDHLSFLTTRTRSMLQWASLLGTEFGFTHLAVTGEQDPAGLTGSVEEALATGILVNDGEVLRFRHEIVRRALYHQVSGSVRSWLHRNFAEALAAADVRPGYVAEQLAATSAAMDSWARSWLDVHVGDIAAERPELAVVLLRRAIGSAPRDQERSERHSAVLTRLLFWMGREADVEARSVLARTTDPELAGEMRWILAYLQFRRGQFTGAEMETERTLADPRVGPCWRERHERLLAVLPGDQSPGGDPAREVEDLVLLDEAGRAAVAAGEVTWQLAVEQALPAGIHVALAVQRYETADYRGARLELAALTEVEPRRGSYIRRRLGVVIHSLAALVAADYDDPRAAELRLREAAECAGPAGAVAPGGALLLVAKSELAEVRGRPAEAMEALLRLAELDAAAAARRLWLPRMARLAVRLGDGRRVEQVRRAAGAEPEEPDEDRYVRRYCDALFGGDPKTMLSVAGSLGDDQLRLRAFEDAAWLFARAGRAGEAHDALRQARTQYRRAGSAWGVRRVDEVTRFLVRPRRKIVNAF